MKKKIKEDKQIEKILSVIRYEPKSAYQISKESGVSICSVYRKLKFLKEKNLLKVSGTITEEGVRINKYLNALRANHNKLNL